MPREPKGQTGPTRLWRQTSASCPDCFLEHLPNASLPMTGIEVRKTEVYVRWLDSLRDGRPGLAFWRGLPASNPGSVPSTSTASRLITWTTWFYGKAWLGPEPLFQYFEWRFTLRGSDSCGTSPCMPRALPRRTCNRQVDRSCAPRVALAEERVQFGVGDDIGETVESAFAGNGAGGFHEGVHCDA